MTRGRRRSRPAIGLAARRGLTARESEVLALITQGLSNAQIADCTHLSINSVKTYIRSAYRRIGAPVPHGGGAVGGRGARIPSGPAARARPPEIPELPKTGSVAETGSVGHEE